MPLKMFLNFCFELWHLYKSLVPSAKGLSFTLCNFYFLNLSLHLGVANMRVCFMNGPMIEHDGLGITYFSVDILKDMVAC